MPLPTTDELLITTPIVNAIMALQTQLHTDLLGVQSRIDTTNINLTTVVSKLEEIRVFHQRYIDERRLPRTSAASLLLSEAFGNEDLDDDADGAIYGNDFVIDPADPEKPQLLKGESLPVDSGAPTKTWQEYLDTIEEESYHA